MLTASMRLAAVGIIGLLFATGSLGLSEAPFERYKIPEPHWYDGWLADRAVEAAAGTDRRSLLQSGLLPRGHSGSTTCNIKIQGTGKKFGLESASIDCTTTDKFWKAAPFNGQIQIFCGRPVFDYAKKNPSKFKGVKLYLPNDNNFLGKNNAEPVLFFVQAGKVRMSGWVRDMSVTDWAVTHIENGTEATFDGFSWSGNHGVRFPTLAGARSVLKVYNAKFYNNDCTSKTRCHTPGIYATEGERITVSNTRFSANRGHLAGAVMMTSGALGVLTNNTFVGNKVVNYGDFGGAIFHDFCDRDGRTKGGRSTISYNTFEDNRSEGFGGAIRLGSPDGGCPRTQIKHNTFRGNKAKIIGGAIHTSYCHGVTLSLYKNKFISNSASQFNGQVAYNPTRMAQGQPGAGSKTAGGCPQPTTYDSTFSGSAPRFSKPWYFP